MKTKVITLFIAAMVSFSLLAQDKKKIPANPEEMAKQRTEQMKEKLGLTAEQQEKINAIFLKEAQEQAALRDASKEQRKQMREASEEQRKQMRERREAIEAEVKSQLTPEQQAKYEEMKKDQRKRPNRQNARGFRGGDRK